MTKRNPDKELLQNVAIFSKTCSTEFEKSLGMRAIVNIVFVTNTGFALYFDENCLSQESK